MSTARLILHIIVLIVLASSLTMMGQEQRAEPKWKPLTEQPLPAIDGANLKLTVVEADYPPGGSSKPQEHSGSAFIYVTEGSIISQAEGQPPRTDTKHLVSQNASKPVSATLAAYFVADKSQKEKAVAEPIIRQRVEDYAKAISAKDIDRVMSLYAPSIVSFDLNPPLRYAGTDNKRRAWQEFFATYTGPVSYEVRDLNVTTDGDLAFVYSLNHVKGTLASGHVTDLWMRWTACFRRIDGVWLVVHDHVSDPADLEHGKAVLNLTP